MFKLEKGIPKGHAFYVQLFSDNSCFHVFSSYPSIMRSPYVRTQPRIPPVITRD